MWKRPCALETQGVTANNLHLIFLIIEQLYWRPCSCFTQFYTGKGDTAEGVYWNNLINLSFPTFFSLVLVLILAWANPIGSIQFYFYLHNIIWRDLSRGQLTPWSNAVIMGPHPTTTRASKHKTFVWHLYNVGPTSKTLGRRCINVIQMFCVCWRANRHSLRPWPNIKTMSRVWWPLLNVTRVTGAIMIMFKNSCCDIDPLRLQRCCYF